MTLTMIERIRRRPRARQQDAGISILDAIGDDRLFAPWFRNKASWAAWRAFLAALFALPMTQDQLATFKECTGRDAQPDEPAKEAWLICGRRAGKSFTLAIIAVWLSCFRDYRPYLQPGERATFMVIAADRKQARTIMRYIAGLLKGVPMLSRLIEREAAESISLSNQVTIEVHTASFRSARGYTCCGAAVDELAFFRSEDSANPDYEILNALRPAMVTIPGALLLCASSPYARRGALWQAWKSHFGKAGNILVWRAATRTMNPSVPQSYIDAEYEKDPAHAAAEYGAEFRTDIESLVPLEVVTACVSQGIRERAPVGGISYKAFIDPSGGSSDSMTLAVAHRRGEELILDCLREVRPPFSPDDVVAEFAATLKSYRVARIVGDRYAGLWVREPFLKYGITYEAAAAPKSDLYRDLLPLLNSGRAKLLDNERLVNQIVGLERRTARGGRDSIDHAPGGHDDLANVCAGALTSLANNKSSYTLDNILMTDAERTQRSSVAAIAALAARMGV